MNLVAVLVAPAVVKLTVGAHASIGLRILIAVVAIAIIVAAVVISKRRKISMGGPAVGVDGPVGGLGGGDAVEVVEVVEIGRGRRELVESQPGE